MESLYKVPSKSCSDKKRQAFWSHVLSDQINSGMSMVKFCELHGLKYTTFKSHRYSKKHIKAIAKTSTKNPIDIARDVTQPATNKFIPVQIDNLSAADIAEITPEKNKNIAAEIKIVFKNGYEVILPSMIMDNDGLLPIIKTVAGL